MKKIVNLCVTYTVDEKNDEDAINRAFSILRDEVDSKEMCLERIFASSVIEGSDGDESNVTEREKQIELCEGI